LKSVAAMTRAEFGAYVCNALASAGIDAVLSGGSCVSIWTEEMYVSNDLDFITSGYENNRRIASVLQQLGFERPSNYSRYFTHPDSRFAVEFPTGPLALGREQISPGDAELLTTSQGVLKLLSPTDCIKDRLAAFYAWQDRQSFEQAVMVACRHGIRWDNLEKWHKAEGESNGFKKFKDAVEAAKPSRER